MKSEKEEILFTCEFCKRKITKEVLDVMEEGSEYCDCEKSFKIIELEKEQKATRQQTRTETLKEVFEDLDRIMIRRHLPNCRLRWIITENAFGRLKKKYLGVKK